MKTNRIKQLKEVKDINQYYEAIGEDTFAAIAYKILMAYIYMPVAALIAEMVTAIFVGGPSSDAKLVADRTLYQVIFGCISTVALVFAVIFIVCWIPTKKGQLKELFKNTFKTKPYIIFFISLLLWSCICTLNSDDIIFSIGGTEYRYDGLMSYFFYASAFLCAYLVAKKDNLKGLMIQFLYVSSFVSVIVMLQDFGAPFFKTCFHEYSARAGMFYHFNHTGYYMNLGIVCAMGLYMFEEGKKRFLYLALMGLQVYGILVNSTFGSYLGSFFAMFFLFIMCFRKGVKAWGKCLAVLAVFLLISTASYFGYVPTSSHETMKENMEMFFSDADRITSGDEEEADEAGHGRMTLWKQGLKMIPESPILGYGPEMLNPKYAKKMWIDRPDNEFIQCAIFTGIPGLAMYLAALFSLFAIRWKNLKQTNKSVVVAAACVFAYYISACFGNSMFYTVIYLFIFLGMISGDSQEGL